MRMHTGAASAEAASAVGAKAYATGNDVHFGAGHYDPSSSSGQELIAHEVAHTVQQRGGSPARQHKLEVSSPGDHAEVEADRAASAMVVGAPAQVGGASGLGRVMRAPAAAGATPGVGASNGVSATGGGKVSGKGCEVKATIISQAKIPTTYADLTLKGTAAVSGTLDWSSQGQVNMPEIEFGAGGGNKDEKKKDKTEHSDSVGVDGGVDLSEYELGEAKEEAIAESRKETKKDWDSTAADYGEWKITQSAKFGGEVEKGEEVKHTATAGYTVTLAGTFKNGTAVSVALRVLTLGSENGKATGQVLGVEVSGSSPPLHIDHTLKRGVKFKGSIQPTIAFSVEPKWRAIVMEVLKQGGKDAALTAAETAATAAEVGVGVEAAAATFAIGMFVGIGGSTVAALVMGAKEIAEWNEVVKQLDQGSEGFATGVLASLGVDGGPKFAPYTMSGVVHGTQKLNEIVAKAQAIPSVKTAKLTNSEIRGAICDAAAKHSAELRPAMVAAARAQIGEALVRDYYARHKKDWFFTKSDAQGLAHTMGLEKGHDIDLEPQEDKGGSPE
ncbi:MAG: DUF4157 domain-containing protein [Deltaproteobacteria bacterium]